MWALASQCTHTQRQRETKRGRERQREKKRDKERQRETLTHTHTHIHRTHTHTHNAAALLFLSPQLGQINSATENEASRFGRFLNETMRTLARFHGSSATYQRECAPTPGFIASFKKGEEPKTVKYAEYQRMCYNWQSRLLKVRQCA